MARNEEKNQSMLNRWLRMKMDEKKPPEKRPYLASEVSSIQECEKWRWEIVKEVSDKMTEIQNTSLEEHKIRDLNDEINRLIRQKRHWERRIMELGGPDYAVISGKFVDADGREVNVGTGYKYFGAARNLPGVKELLNPDEQIKKKKTRHELYKGVDADYYGFRDEDDGILKKVEADAEKDVRVHMVKEWNKKNPNKKPYKERNHSYTAKTATTVTRLPTKEEFEMMLVERKKKELLEQLGGESSSTMEVEENHAT